MQNLADGLVLRHVLAAAGHDPSGYNNVYNHSADLPHGHLLYRKHVQPQ